MNQKEALKKIESGENIFLTGPPGSGKTHLLRKFISRSKKKGKRVGVTASTGIAATHLNGRTIHSWSGIGIKKDLTKEEVDEIAKKPYVMEKAIGSDSLIIDEVSMLDPRQFNLIDIVLRRIRKKKEPFGGIQLILSGDFFQLPPIRKRGGTKFITDTKAWENLNPSICYLKEQYRQKDKKLTKVLRDIRRRKVTKETILLLKERIKKEVDLEIEPTRLYTHNKDVDAINSWELEKIEGKSYYYEMKEKGKKNLTKSLKNSCLAPEHLRLKKGAKVMFLKNSFREGYVNGTLGEIKEFTSSGLPVVRTTKGKEIEASPKTWKLEENRETKAEIKQIPLRLAWAITVHKSQGMTLDLAEIDLGSAFEKGMGYVALSRVKSLDGIKLKRFNKISLEVSEKAAKLDKEFKRLSD